MVKKIKYYNKSDGDMVDTPYGADRENGIIYTNPKLASRLSIFEKKFWLLHEKGHIVLDTADEIKADNYAFDRLAGTEFRSLKQMIEAEEHLLTSGSKYHQQRIDNLYQRAIEWDKKHPELNRADGSTEVKKAELAAREAEENRKMIETLGANMLAMQQQSADSTRQATQTGMLGTTMSTSSLLIIGLIAILLLRKQ